MNKSATWVAKASRHLERHSKEQECGFPHHSCETCFVAGLCCRNLIVRETTRSRAAFPRLTNPSPSLTATWQPTGLTSMPCSRRFVGRPPRHVCVLASLAVAAPPLPGLIPTTAVAPHRPRVEPEQADEGRHDHHSKPRDLSRRLHLPRRSHGPLSCRGRPSAPPLYDARRRFERAAAAKCAGRFVPILRFDFPPCRPRLPTVRRAPLTLICSPCRQSKDCHHTNGRRVPGP